MIEHLKAFFPKLTAESCRVTSERDPGYNCIAWAAQITHQRWWPLENPEEAYWPAGVPRIATLEAFQAAFETLAYSTYAPEEMKPGFEKVALFADINGVPTHAARQLANGRWTSKLGKAEDIEHDLRDLEGDLYGTVALLMSRRNTAGAKNAAENG